MIHSILPVLILVSTPLFSLCQTTINEYLQNNRQDIANHPSIDLHNATLIGFGAIHGSSKTEDAEVLLITELAKNHDLKYYLPETDFSTANYFQQYIQTGDDNLLKELIAAYGVMVPQERSIEVYEKWKKLRPIFLEHDIQVIGVDKIASFKFTFRELIAITNNSVQWDYRDSLIDRLADHDMEWSIFENLSLKGFTKRFIEDFTQNERLYKNAIEDTFKFNHIVRNLKHTYETYAREPFMYENYVLLNEKYNLQASLQFARLGIFHIMQSEINDVGTFFSRLIEGGVYTKSEILTIQAFLWNSSVLWNNRDRHGNTSYGTKNGFGIGDYWNEYFYKISEIKKEALSDMTLFDLSNKNSPYTKQDEFRLVKVKMLFGKPNWSPTKGKNTLDYIDCALLIKNSAANHSLDELE